MGGGGGGGWTSGKVHSEHIAATKVLLPARGMQSIFELPSCFLLLGYFLIHRNG